ncbi:hypothetical protein [Microbacterium deminutum]|uniref:hypothetical protein n=1 Tax=Microbacterium deminutum TaxID=344164 RepID=UPI0031D6950E
MPQTRGADAAATGVPVLRPLLLEFPDDPAMLHLDRQYLLGSDILVAPVFTADGVVEFYLPAGEWTNLLTGESVAGGAWRRETHGFDSLPLYLRPGAVLRGAPVPTSPTTTTSTGSSCGSSPAAEVRAIWSSRPLTDERRHSRSTSVPSGPEARSERDAGWALAWGAGASSAAAEGGRAVLAR